MLKIDGKEEHFKKINNNSSIINYTIENHIIKFAKPSNVKIFTKRGIVMYENTNVTEISKIDYLNGDYFIWIDGLIYHLGI